MPRVTTEPTKNVNFRMPAALLNEIDSLAKTNHRERTSEINCACRRWIETGGRTMDTPLDTEIENLKTEIVTLKGKIQEMHQEIAEQNQMITTLASELKNERTAMLDIMAKDKSIIDSLCSGILGQIKETQVPGMEKIKAWGK